MVTMIIGIVVVLAIAALFAVLTCKSKHNDLFRWLFIFLFIAVAFTWIFPNGAFSAGEFYDYGMTRLGLSDIPTTIYYALYFILTTVIYLLVLGGFYGILSKTKSYQTLVRNTARSIKGREVLATIIAIVVIVVLTSILKNALVVVALLPFAVSVFLHAKFDKVTTAGITFGSMLVGLLGATYGTDGLYWFNQYLQLDFDFAITYRLVFGGIALILFILYNAYRVTKVVKNNKNSDIEEEVFAIEEKDSSKKKAATWPAIVILAIMFLYLFVGCFNWSGILNVTVFSEFLEWVVEWAPFKVGGEDFAIIGSILGTEPTALGNLEITSLVTFFLLLSVLVAFMNGMKLNEYFEAFGEGFKKFVKPTALYVLSYMLFIVIYRSAFTAVISDWMLNLTEELNPFIAMINAFFTSIFHADLGYTSYMLGSLISATGDSYRLFHTIYVTAYGFVQLVMPTSGLLLIGLAYLNVDYKQWFKYIWMFALAIIVAALLCVTIMWIVI